MQDRAGYAGFFFFFIWSTASAADLRSRILKLENNRRAAESAEEAQRIEIKAVSYSRKLFEKLLTIRQSPSLSSSQF